MSFVFKEIPQEYNAEIFREIFQEIEAATQFPVVNGMRLDVLNVVPDKLFEGLMVNADGTNWNPGAGAGVYIYRGTAWVHLG